ncbi:MAG TPA: hypothetical protein DIT25_01780 [Candidatus Moranbacteria bacterium]|nr:hypothetical protein [Candidatus Moranbacteria bacterium]
MEVGAVIKHDISNAARTGDWRYMKPVVDKEKCSGCSTCVPYCPDAAIVVERDSHIVNRELAGSTIRDPRYAQIDYDFCKGCGVCAQVCPLRSITMKKS